jgi:hypothetical protein
MIHCVGKILPKTGSSSTLDNLELVVYLPPCEVEEYREDLQQPIGYITQVFGKEIALPHLDHLESRCHISNIPPMRVIRPFNLEQSEPDERVIKLLTDPNNEAKFKLRCYEEQAKKGKNKFGDVLDAESVYDGDSSLDYDEVSWVMDRVEHEYFSNPPAASRTNVLATQPQTSRKAQNGHVRQAKQEAGIDRAPIIVAPGHVKVCGPASSPSPNPHTILFQRPVPGKTLRPAPIEAIVTIGPATDKAIDHLNLEELTNSENLTKKYLKNESTWISFFFWSQGSWFNFPCHIVDLRSARSQPTTRKMSSHTYNIVKLRRATQGPITRKRPPKVKLSTEAKQLLKFRRRNAQAAYQTDLNKAWDLIDVTITKIAEKHSKSFQHVQFALHAGRRSTKHSSQHKSSVWNVFLWKEAGGATAG